MHKKEYPILCGGTFFTLLLEAAKPGLKWRKRGQGTKAEFTEMDVFEALLQIIVPTYRRPDNPDNFKSIVSAYKSCNTNKSGRLSFHQQANMMSFDNMMYYDRRTLLAKMEELLDRFIDVDGKGIWLAKALLELIKLDSGIPSSATFAVQENGSSVTKEILVNSSAINLAALLLGVWHYIVMNKIDNSAGRQTYDSWCRPGRSPNTREPFQSDIGSGIEQGISLVQATFEYTPEESGCEEPDWEEPQYSYYEPGEQDEYIPPNYSHKQNSYFIRQYGNNNQFIGSIGTLIINND